MPDEDVVKPARAGVVEVIVGVAEFCGVIIV